MKKIIAFLLVLIINFSVLGCEPVVTDAADKIDASNSRNELPLSYMQYVNVKTIVLRYFINSSTATNQSSKSNIGEQYLIEQSKDYLNGNQEMYKLDYARMQTVYELCKKNNIQVDTNYVNDMVKELQTIYNDYSSYNKQDARAQYMDQIVNYINKSNISINEFINTQYKGYSEIYYMNMALESFFIKNIYKGEYINGEKFQSLSEQYGEDEAYEIIGKNGIVIDGEYQKYLDDAMK